MFATKLKGQITPERKLVVDIPAGVAPGAVEVILLQDTSVKVTRRQTRRKSGHPAFGLWAKRPDLTDAAAFAAQLRQRIEQQGDRRG